jgi:CRP/FNR family transcriptional regulator, dissimilatory nitrate respiration regulator
MIEPCNKHCAYCFLEFTDVMSTENLFFGISQQEIGEIIQSVHHQVKQFSQNETILYENDAYESLLILLKGNVTTEMMSEDGQILVVEQLQAPSVLAPAALFSSESQIPVSVIAHSDCRVLLIPRDSTKQILAQNPIVLTNFLRILSNRVQFLSQKMKMLQFQSLRCKVAQHLLQLQRVQNSNSIKLLKTQQELSDIFGVARPSLARVIRELHNDGIIEAKGKQINIINLGALKKCLK